MSASGKKIDDEFENPFDIWIIKLAQLININIFRPLNFTPNMITTLSLLTGLFSAWLLYSRFYIYSSLLFLISYILDCCDGNYARMFNMVTKIGDFYDHISDFIKNALICILILVNNRLQKIVKIIFFILLSILFILSNIHLGCQERMYNNKEFDSLSVLKYLCPNKNYIKYTRYFGVGTNILFLVLFMASISLFEIKPS